MIPFPFDKGKGIISFRRGCAPSSFPQYNGIIYEGQNQAVDMSFLMILVTEETVLPRADC